MEGVYKISNRLKQCSAEYRKSLYKENKGVERFVKMRRMALCTLMILVVIHEIINLVLVIRGIQSMQYLWGNLMKLAVYLVLLILPLLGKWPLSLGLYFMAIPTILSFVVAWDAIISIRYTALPLLLTLISIEILFAVLIVAVTLWLTISPKSHRFADKSREIHLDYMRFINENITTMTDE